MPENETVLEPAGAGVWAALVLAALTLGPVLLVARTPVPEPV
ncbi:hypothetical protein [Kineococcus aurantiacus]|uniref:Uncharacterized protein n=1 Tax=Kineococcus aurantiacus TaxID=37633 RepID=A0A7Y9J0T8_9ACTN|nr:hypothetical protein [Kineococcus aurantiacus]NYD22567.1 hypothetical protein [Kineococcus aurantiacus]